MLSGCNQHSGRRERDTVIAANAPANPDVLAWFCPHVLPRIQDTLISTLLHCTVQGKRNATTAYPNL